MTDRNLRASKKATATTATPSKSPAKKVTAAKKTSPGKDGTPCRARDNPAPALPTTPGKVWTVKFTCHECGQHFDRFESYEKHMERRHPACPRKPTDGPARDPTPKATTKAKGKGNATGDDDHGHDHDDDDDDHDDEEDNDDDNGKGNEAGPSTRRGTSKGKARRRPTPDDATLFRIFRLVRNTDKAKGQTKQPILKLTEKGSKLEWGGFLLDLTPDMADQNPNVRAIDHREGRIAKRMLQRIDLPWGLEEELEFTTEDDGTPMLMAKVSEEIPVSGRNATAFQKGELVLVCQTREVEGLGGQREADDLHVYDFEGKPGLLQSDEVDFPIQVPWNLRLDDKKWRERMDRMVTKAKGSSEKDNGEGPSSSRKRKTPLAPEGDNGGEGPSTGRSRKKTPQPPSDSTKADPPTPSKAKKSKTATPADHGNGDGPSNGSSKKRKVATLAGGDDDDDAAAAPPKKAKKKIIVPRRRN